MKARHVLGAAAVLACAVGFGCETSHQYSHVSYPESVMDGASDSIGCAVFSPQVQSRMYAHKLDVDSKTAVAGVEDNAGN
ncbi:MAG TPA: hypothetical protein VHC70_10910 [Phycisphaerales bacterium]|jgi:hypothetical protein|nr:hypothetical protein [Phycisphaerales bacterium]